MELTVCLVCGDKSTKPKQSKANFIWSDDLTSNKYTIKLNKNKQSALDINEPKEKMK